jgi:hypothetical protein
LPGCPPYVDVALREAHEPVLYEVPEIGAGVQANKAFPIPDPLVELCADLLEVPVRGPFAAISDRVGILGPEPGLEEVSLLFLTDLH